MAPRDTQPKLGPDQLDDLAVLLDVVRSAGSSTRPALVHRSHLGRSVVAQRTAELLDIGLIAEDGLAASAGGRAPRRLRFRSEAGRVLAATLGATSISAAISDLAGSISVQREELFDLALGPERVLARLEVIFADLLEADSEQRPSAPPLWGIGVGLPGPVEFATGRPVAPPIMPGWDGYPARERLAKHFDVPAWVDNDVNLAALGELRAGMAKGLDDVIFVKIGTGIGAGLVSRGRLHRGAQGAAGDIGHVAVQADEAVLCRCGNVGCLEALASGYALGRDAARAAIEGTSAYLKLKTAEGKAVDARSVAEGASNGDAFCVDLLNRSGRLVGETLATLVNFYNPSLIVIGGGISGAGNILLAGIRETIYRRSLPLATRDLRIALSSLGEVAGTMGAAWLVTDELFSRACLGSWIDEGSPVGLPEIGTAQPA